MRHASRLLVVLLAALSLVPNPGLYGQSNTGDETRKKAFELFREDKHIEALPLFEELALKHPDDRDVLLGLGVCWWQNRQLSMIRKRRHENVYVRDRCC